MKTAPPTESAGVTKRAHCAQCQRPQSTCICQWVTPVAHVVEVLILQHPLEVAHAKGSARLLHLSLPHSRLVTGEVFDMQGCLAQMDAALEDGMRPKRNMLLYPSLEAGHTNGTPTPPPLESACLQTPSQLRLIVLDGTWRKSRKMLCLNPLLQQLPRLSLQGLPTSQYLIRKAHRPGQLSSLEATCAALAQLEGEPGRFVPLLRAFDGFVAQQSSYQAGQGP
jgi:DTW domain-containing protein